VYTRITNKYKRGVLYYLFSGLSDITAIKDRLGSQEEMIKQILLMLRSSAARGPQQ